MRAQVLLASLSGAIVLGVMASPASPSPTGSIERKVVQTIPVEGTDEELEMTLVTFPPGAQSPPHVHPVDGMVYIIEGTAESRYEGGTLEHYRTGDSYLDQKDRVHQVFRNTSSTTPLRFLIACKIRKGVPFKQDLPEKPPKP